MSVGRTRGKVRTLASSVAEADVFSAAVDRAYAIVPSAAAAGHSAVLRGLFVRVVSGRAEVCAGNHESRVAASFEAKQASGDSGVVVEAGRLRSVARALEGEVEIVADVAGLSLAAGRGTVRLARWAAGAEHFPTPKAAHAAETAVLDADRFGRALTYALRTVGDSDGGHAPRFIDVRVADGRCSVTSTDAYRASRASFDVATDPVRLLIGTGGARVLRAACASAEDRIVLSIDSDRRTYVETDILRGSLRGHDVAMPDFDRVFAGEFPFSFRFDPAAVKSILGRVAVVARGARYPRCVVSLRGDSGEILHDSDAGSVREEFAFAEAASEGRSFVVAPGYLSEALSVADLVDFRCDDAGRAIRVVSRSDGVEIDEIVACIGKESRCP